MLRLTVLLSLTIALLFTQACAQNKTFVSSEGRFSIDLQEAPTEEKNAQLALRDAKKLWWRNERATFSVLFKHFVTEKAEDAEAVVATSADDYIGALPKAAEIVSKNKITLDGYPGFEVKSREKDGFTVINRYYQVEDRFYGVTVMWTAGPNDEYAIKTLESFKVLKAASVQ
ncbi:MAG TPA: hypothetical protein VGO50_05185 [Pyrinomonadaceae bacterium]|jgi:hypothetical protein|nr:hypothetical protein [Pyrinomonadaceae bacterium]